ncbi:hypothetical protein HOY80DRAFT_942356 [Tuber brumale]|nr:hypothetical protein HOY80DRAFT_942356 [Tuber brumale]
MVMECNDGIRCTFFSFFSFLLFRGLIVNRPRVLGVCVCESMILSNFDSFVGITVCVCVTALLQILGQCVLVMS